MVCWRISQGLVKVNKITSEIRSIEFVLKFSVHLVRISCQHSNPTIYQINLAVLDDRTAYYYCMHFLLHHHGRVVLSRYKFGIKIRGGTFALAISA